MNDKHERLCELVAVCVKNKLTPQKNIFCDFILGACASLYGYERRTARSYVDVLLSAWRFDRWESYIQKNELLKEGDLAEWMKMT